jgi:transposase
MAKQAETARQLRTALSVLLPQTCGVTNATTGQVLGVGVATVVRMQKEIRDQIAGCRTQKGTWGGRRRRHMSMEEERRFIEPWIEKAETGGVLVVPPIHEALEQHLGFPVATSTVYRMLARHGWGKVAPDTCHPKRDAQAKEDFKKNSMKRRHKPLSKTG